MPSKLIDRQYLSDITSKMKNNPVVALLGPRQVGKSTLAKQIVALHTDAVYLDLELDSDRLKIESDPELFFRANPHKLVCLDEIHFLPNIFKVLRSIVDKTGANGQFLILGSASRDLIKQSGETLAGRISYIEITPFDRLETKDHQPALDSWLRGGYPRSALAPSLEVSYDWRDDYIRSFLERDLPSLGFRIPAPTLRRFWTMLAHSHGQILNYSKLAASMDVSIPTIKNYIDILEQTFLIRVLRPYFSNAKKRLIKSPKVYIRDSGLLHALLKIETLNELLAHPVAGGSFEGFVIENIVNQYPRHEAFFFRDSSQNEIDLLLVKGLQSIAIEIKMSTSPKVGPGFWKAVNFVKSSEKWLIGQVASGYTGKDELQVCNIDDFLSQFIEKF